MKKDYQRTLTTIAKLMKYALSYRPDEFGLIVDENGFVFLKDLLQAIKEEKNWSFVRLSHITDIVNFFDRSAFELKEGKIRATERYFHFSPKIPPKILYAAVRLKVYPHTLEHGLTPGKYTFIPLAINKELALRIGKRRDSKPVLIEIHALKAARDGIDFYCLNELLYLVKKMPAQYISGPPVEKVIPKVQKRISVSSPVLPKPLLLTPEMFYSEKMDRAKRYARKKAKKKK